MNVIGIVNIKQTFIQKIEVISKEEYLKVHYGDRKDYFRLAEVSQQHISVKNYI